MLSLRHVVGPLSIGLMVLGSNTVISQPYPSKPVRIVTGNAGGGSDFTSRVLAQGLAGPLGQPVIVDNRGGVLQAEVASKAPPDGYTLLVTGASLWTVPLLRDNVPWDPVRDFLPVSLVVREVQMLAVHPSLPVKSVKELIALARAKPGELNYASEAAGGPAHLGAELFKSMSKVNIVHIRYKGTAAATTALISGEVQVTINDAGLLAPHVKSGKLHALAVTSAQPSARFPGLPTVAASGLPGYEWVSMTGIWAPAKTPAAIIERLNQEIVRLLNQSEVKERFLKIGAEVAPTSPEQFAAIIKADIAKMSKVIKDAGIKAD